jgi:hypothetical protein
MEWIGMEAERTKRRYVPIVSRMEKRLLRFAKINCRGEGRVSEKEFLRHPEFRKERVSRNRVVRAILTGMKNRLLRIRWNEAEGALVAILVTGKS